MYKFIKTHDKDYGTSDVVMTIKNNDVTLDDLMDEFDRFLQACGFCLPIRDDSDVYRIAKQEDIKKDKKLKR